MKSNEEHFTMTTLDADPRTTVCFDSNVHHTSEIPMSCYLII